MEFESILEISSFVHRNQSSRVINKMMNYDMRNTSPAETNETITMPHVLELVGVCHSGPITPNRLSLWNKWTNYPPSGLILKDVSFEVSNDDDDYYVN